MKFRLVVVVLAALAIGAAGGCGPKGLKLVKVSGTVKFKDGAALPAPEAGKGPNTVNFRPVGEAVAGQPRKGAGGTIDANGHFDVMTLKPGDGLIPGKYHVSVFAPGIPDVYRDADKSGLEYDIQKATTDLVVELDKDKKEEKK
jgi:hypothetical protein